MNNKDLFSFEVNFRNSEQYSKFDIWTVETKTISYDLLFKIIKYYVNVYDGW